MLVILYNNYVLVLYYWNIYYHRLSYSDSRTVLMLKALCIYIAIASPYLAGRSVTGWYQSLGSYPISTTS